MKMVVPPYLAVRIKYKLLYKSPHSVSSSCLLLEEYVSTGDEFIQTEQEQRGVYFVEKNFLVTTVVLFSFPPWLPPLPGIFLTTSPPPLSPG